MQAGNAPLIDGMRDHGKIVQLPNEKPGILYNDI